MDASITTRLNSNYNHIDTVYVEYPYRLDVKPIESVETGEILPTASGFTWKYEPASISLKTYKSLSDQGYKKLADYVIRNRKRSIVTPNHIWNSIMAFGHKRPPKTNLRSYEYAKGIVRAALKVDKKIPILSVADGSRSIPRFTSPGLPWIIKTPGLKIGQILNRYSLPMKDYWFKVGAGLPVIPLPDCAAFARSEISSPDKNMIRTIWAYPLLALVQESRFAVPIFELLENQQILPQTFYGTEVMKGGMTWLHSQVMRAKHFDPGCKFMMLDYSAFNSSVPAWLILDSFQLLAEKFDFSHVSENGIILPVDEKQERRKFNKIVDYFINTPIRNFDGRRYRKAHGVPLGSLFANIIDTIVNLLIMYTICDASLECSPLFELAFSNEGMICIPSTSLADLECFSAVAKQVFGMTVNVNKSYATTNIKNIYFLGYFNNLGTPFKDSIDLIAPMLYPHYSNDKWSYCITLAFICMIATVGMNSDAFKCACAVWYYASRIPGVLNKGIELMKINPTLRQYLDRLGFGNLPYSHGFFVNIDMLIPMWTCQKIVQNIQLVKPPFIV